MTWQPNQPVVSAADVANWQAWCKARKLQSQRDRRHDCRRIDYYASLQAQAIIDAKRAPYHPLNTNSGAIDAIIAEWAELTGIKCEQVATPATLVNCAGIGRHICAGANEFGDELPAWAPAYLARCRARESRKSVLCGARRRRDGNPCRALSVPGKRRCKWHGGMSTGPRTPEGKVKVTRNLPAMSRAEFCDA